MENILNPLMGGILIGLSTSILLLFLGRIAGISGIISEFVSGFKIDHYWKVSFVAGLVFGGFLVMLLKPTFFSYSIDASVLKIICAGLLVGVGTRLGNGCTSGHGVCGISIMSKRSIVATVSFIITGIVTVLIERLLN